MSPFNYLRDPKNEVAKQKKLKGRGKSRNTTSKRGLWEVGEWGGGVVSVKKLGQGRLIVSVTQFLNKGTEKGVGKQSKTETADEKVRRKKDFLISKEEAKF